MENPKPVDVSNLASILGNARKIMNKVDKGDYETGHVNEMALTENGVNQLMEQGYQPKNSGSNFKNMESSRMDPAIKKMMLETPTNGAPQTFNLSDVSDLIEKPMPVNGGYTKKSISESHNQDGEKVYNLTESQLKNMINESLMEFMTKTFVKNLSESVIKSTITTLIKEGKINIKKK
jgi:hypothetical protein